MMVMGMVRVLVCQHVKCFQHPDRGCSLRDQLQLPI
jgi:hypothetical protein